MNIRMESRAAAHIETEALVTFVFEKDGRVENLVAELDQATGGQIKALCDSGELTGKYAEMTLLHQAPGMTARRLLLVGAGKPEKWGGRELRRATGAALRHLKSRKVRNLAVLAREMNRDAASAQAITEGLLLADFESDTYKTDKKDDQQVETAALAGFDGGSFAKAERGVATGRITSDAQNFTRALVNEPSNKLTPRVLADRAAAMAREAGLGVDILDEKRIAELKMGALLSVAQGSAEPPRMIVISYTPGKEKAGAPVLGLVGKAVTFDTGGISIKPADGMEKMKYDMAGGATMLGVMKALAQLQPAIRVICVVPATENMPGGRAQKPGDVQIAMSGKSIEVINTDAEGRLILADGLAYARKLGCTHLVDAATLTGAIVVALANVNMGVFGSHQEFTDRLLASARVAGEKMWPMPLDDEYREMIKSNIADIQNVGSGKGGGAVTAAMFLKEFTEELPWIHLDIAGVTWFDEAKPFAAKGPTGIGVRTLIDFVMKYPS